MPINDANGAELAENDTITLSGRITSIQEDAEDNHVTFETKTGRTLSVSAAEVVKAE